MPKSAEESVHERATALLDRHRAGDAAALGELFTLFRDRLWRMLYVRLDRRVQARLTPDDVLQETFLDVSRRVGEYLADPAVAFYVWLRFLTVQRMQMMQRVHLGADMRGVQREVAGTAGVDRIDGRSIGERSDQPEPGRHPPRVAGAIAVGTGRDGPSGPRGSGSAALRGIGQSAKWPRFWEYRKTPRASGMFALKRLKAILSGSNAK